MIVITQDIINNTADRMASKPVGIMFPLILQTVRNGGCAMCGKPVKSVRNHLELREYGISGMCSECQQEAFAPGE